MKKMHVLVLKCLPKSQQAVQSCHVVADYIQHVGIDDDEWDGTIVIHKTDEETLEHFIEVIMYRDFLPVIGFHEPDMDDELTAVAFLGGDDLVKNIPLL